MFQTLNLYDSSHHFFQLLQVDFTLHKTLHPFIADVNLSPRFPTSNPQTEENAPTYEQIIYHTARLVGIASNFEILTG